MAVPPQGAQQGAQQQQQKPLIDIEQLMQTYDPKQLMMLGQALNSLLKVQAATAPRPDPRELMMQPGPMAQMAQLELLRRRREQAMQQQGQQGQPGLPVPM